MREVERRGPVTERGINDTHLYVTAFPRVFHLARYRGAHAANSTFETVCGRRAWPLRYGHDTAPIKQCAACERANA